MQAQGLPQTKSNDKIEIYRFTFLPVDRASLPAAWRYNELIRQERKQGTQYTFVNLRLDHLLLHFKIISFSNSFTYWAHYKNAIRVIIILQHYMRGFTGTIASGRIKNSTGKFRALKYSSHTEPQAIKIYFKPRVLH